VARKYTVIAMLYLLVVERQFASLRCILCGWRIEMDGFVEMLHRIALESQDIDLRELVYHIVRASLARNHHINWSRSWTKVFPIK
jgi:hypothetical protein